MNNKLNKEIFYFLNQHYFDCVKKEISFTGFFSI